MYAFEVERPETIEQAVALLRADDEAQVLAGGQTLIPALKARLAQPSRLVSLTGIAQLKGVRAERGTISVGAGTTHASIAAQAAQHFPALAALAGWVGDPAVRNRGTIGGSLANNDPTACYPAAVLASDATVVTNAREIPAEGFFDGMFATALEEGEIITAVRFPLPQAAAYQKFAQPASRFALVGVFVARFADAVRVAVTGASEEGVFRWHEAEEALTRDFSAQALRGLRMSADDMIGDLHGTPAYRAHLVEVMTARAVAAAGA